MKKTFVAFLAMITSLSISACTAVPQTLPRGAYTKTEKSVNEQGTKMTKETTTDVYYDEHGHKRAVQKTETSRDPKGLFNKDTSTTIKKY